ncbi:kinase-like domain-containing protein [Cantharellus anzutake]|uniref:kinase-like domain-containing protein n=1 Tax=Cantharellus anzutake TaxID=1750568 RepID=UPI001903C335|nr:kinase-like domain-containing protein [Cantharellus anzutake]KAF8343112.1 kinase-like domain-containing protein [Cantharellus anzutake]
MSSTSHLDAASATFIDEFRRGLTSVRDLSGEFNHNAKALKASGGYSCVYAIQWKPSDGDPVQVCYKELRPPASSAPSQVDLTKKTIRHLTREVKIWKSLCHPNIIELIGYAIEGERCDVKAVLVSKWCSNGDVVNYLQRHPESDRVMLIRDMADGLRYLHERVPPMIHGDVKPHNVLISDNGNAQLCDFGLSRVISELTITGQTTSTGIGYTARYSAPEVIVEEVKTTESDVYAFGCTCIHVLFSQPPYPTLKNDLQVLTAIGSGKSPWSWDTGVPLERLLSLCCHKQQEVRPSMDVVLKEIHIVHPPVHPPFASTSTTVDGPSVGSPQKESKDLFLAQIAHSTSDHNKPRPAITFLPVQILVGIFKYLALSDLMRCKQTAKHFLRVIEESLTLQYNIERETCLLAGTAPVAACTVTYSGKLVTVTY